MAELYNYCLSTILIMGRPHTWKKSEWPANLSFTAVVQRTIDLMLGDGYCAIAHQESNSFVVKAEPRVLLCGLSVNYGLQTIYVWTLGKGDAESHLGQIASAYVRRAVHENENGIDVVSSFDFEEQSWPTSAVSSTTAVA